MEEWKEYKLGEVVNILDYKRVPLSSKERSTRHGCYPYYGAQGIIDYIDDYIFDGTYLLIAEDGENLKSQKQNIAQLASGKYWVNNHAHIVESNGLCDIRYLCYILNTMDLSGYITGSAQPKLNQANMSAIAINLPSISTQKRIAEFISAFDDKIEVNRRLNENLEQQAQALFKSWFVDFEPFKNGEFVESELGMIPKGWHISFLGELVTIIDNRGRTPPLCSESSYPIIDVKALSDDGRIINYKNCAKYVSYNTYSTWFRNGHPQKYDILLSTVGSLAEMKLFMYGNGCIAQNVVALRNTNLSLYLYNYLKRIKADLISYNIGSVQPSIKVTHIIKHKILIPDQDVLYKYIKMMKIYSEHIYRNDIESRRLAQLRDTLLPRLMSGELKVNEIENVL